MFAEADLVGVFGVGVIRVDGLGPVRVLGRLRHLTHHVRRAARPQVRRRRVAEPGLRTPVVARGTTRVAGDGGRGLESVQLGRRVHLRLRGSGLGAGRECGRHRADTAEGRGGLFLVQGERVDEPTVRGLRGGSEVEDPGDDDHGQENKAGAGSLRGAAIGVDQRVHREGRKHEPGGQVTNNLY